MVWGWRHERKITAGNTHGELADWKMGKHNLCPFGQRDEGHIPTLLYGDVGHEGTRRHWTSDMAFN